jgi:NADPH:quinone reductase-like Zn-dependent oxidoreductase
MPDQTTSMETLRELLATGKLTPHVGRTFPLAEVARALRCLREGRVLGKIVVTIGA